MLREGVEREFREFEREGLLGPRGAVSGAEAFQSLVSANTTRSQEAHSHSRLIPGFPMPWVRLIAEP